MKEPVGVAFSGLVDLVASSVGGRALGTSDDFFAGVENLLLPGRAEFIPDKYTERGKWMDGWESRRRRGPGHDFCILTLGVPGEVQLFDIDTRHFVGNHPAFASVDGLTAPRGSSFTDLSHHTDWIELLPQMPLLPNAQNLFVPSLGKAVTHLRLNIYPDGGVARFRAHGKVSPEWAEPELDDVALLHVKPGLHDLAALKNGGLALCCSDATFGGMNNLLLAGRAENMGSGWETRRRRYPGYDWIVLRLGARGTISTIEVDTNHFKGNYPDRCTLEFLDRNGAPAYELAHSHDWRPLLPEQKLSPHTRHFFSSELLERAHATHVRLNIFPDGGVSRLRIWGHRDG